MRPLFLLFALALSTLLAACAAPCTSYDLIVYGGSSAGVTAATAAARMGHRVLLIAPSGHLGGLTSSGLGFADIGNPATIGGLSREFFHRVWLAYQDPAAWSAQTRASFAKTPGQGVKAAIDDAGEVQWLFEPHVAERVFNEMAAEAGVDVVTASLPLDDMPRALTKLGPRITAVHTADGRSFSARVFIDATYEGDLLAAAGVPFALGREGNAQYHETIAGVQTARSKGNALPPNIDPYVVKGDPVSGLLPGIRPDAGGPDGSADDLVQAYTYRLCLTDIPANRVMIDKPPGYDERDYELLFRAIEQGQKSGFWKLDRVPNHKTDSNNASGISTDLIGASQGYAIGDDATRRRIAALHERWERGLIWTIQNHPRVPEPIRRASAKWGLAKDEFAWNDHWPTELYVREGRRMLAPFVETELALRDDAAIADPVALGSYAMDSHNVQRYVDPAGHVRNEGDVQIAVPHPYRIAYAAITPGRTACDNLLVPVCLSASHVAYGSIRMEPVFMSLGHAAGAAAAIAIERDLPVQAVPYPELRALLLAQHQALERP